MINGKLASNKILVVDDTPMNIEMLEGLLTPQGYAVEGAESGVEALEKINNWTPDLILLDVMMPQMNGYEVCRRIRGNRDLPYIPVIFITASEFQINDITEGLDAGGNDYIRKPFDVMELFSRINANLRVKALYDELAKTKAELSRYVSLSTARMVEGMVSGHEKPANRTAEVTVLFSDLRGFTQISENSDPEEVFRKLNRNLTKQIGVIEKYGGIIDKLSGDEVMAVFEGHEMVDNAIQCALQIVRKLSASETSEELDWRGVGIGINTGTVYLGSLGTESFKDYTVIGNTVNIAARLCGMANKFQILFTETTRKAIRQQQFHFESIGENPLKGLSKPIEIYQVIL